MDSAPNLKAAHNTYTFFTKYMLPNSPRTKQVEESSQFGQIHI